MKIGYYREFLWREETKEEQQAFYALLEAGCKPVVIGRLQNPNQECPLLKGLLAELQPGDTVYAWTFKHLAGTMGELARIIAQIEERQAGLVIIRDNINSVCFTDGKISGAVALCIATRLQMKQEHTLTGLRRARQAGRIGGRPVTSKLLQKALAAEKLYLHTGLPPDYIVKALNISRSTLYRYLKRRGIKCRR